MTEISDSTGHDLCTTVEAFTEETESGKGAREPGEYRWTAQARRWGPKWHTRARMAQRQHQRLPPSINLGELPYTFFTPALRSHTE